MSRITAVLITATLVLGIAATAESQEKSHRTDWFKDAQWGVFTHYMADTVLDEDKISVEAWNVMVDGYDVDAVAAQLESCGAGYFIITLGQNSGHYCSPNAAYDKFVGISPSKCSKRDLIADLADALKPKGIRLMVYLPSGAPDRDPEAMKALEWKNGQYHEDAHPDGPPEGKTNYRLMAFQRKWEAVIREWSLRWGSKVSGWWFDGCYFTDAMYRHEDAPNFASFAAAARAGNPDSILAFNPGVAYPIGTITKHEDYTAGEINAPKKADCPGRWVGHAQSHMLSFLGPYWCQGPPRFTDEQAIALTRKFTDKGGVVSWDVPPEANGTIPPAFMKQFRAIGKALR